MVGKTLFYIWGTMPDITRRTGRNPAVINYIESRSGQMLAIWEAGKLEKLPKSAVADILVDGPMFDVMTAGTDIIVSKRVKEFLQKRAAADLEFLTVAIRSKKSREVRTRYYGVRFLRSLPAQPNAMKYRLSQIANCPFTAVMAYCRGDDCISTPFLRADVAEELYAAGFTGLGFRNPFDGRKPGENAATPSLEQLRRVPRSPAERRLEKLSMIATKAASIEEGWNNLLRYCATEKRSNAWQGLSNAPVARDLSKSRKWLESVFTSEPPPRSVRAFWVGMFEYYEKGTVTPGLYIAGSTKYADEIRYDIEWAVRPKWWPESRYMNSSVMKLIASHADVHEDLHEALTYTAVLGYGALLLRFGLDSLSAKSRAVLGPEQKPVAVGFDSGDFLFIGELSNSGMSPLKP